jgi:endogenous inhibitor of DNA gyrase (YacG/DUF329 family)
MQWRCPQCKANFNEKGQAFPFCCDRCKLLDLGAWASGKYFIAGSALPEEEEDVTHQQQTLDRLQEDS